MTKLIRWTTWRRDTPPKASKEEWKYPKSPATGTPNRLPKKKAKGSEADQEDDELGISLRDILEIRNALKDEMRDSRKIMEERMSSLETKKTGYLQIVALDFKLLGVGLQLGTLGYRAQSSNHSTTPPRSRRYVMLIVLQPIIACRFWPQKKKLPDLRLVAFQARVIN